MFTFTYFYLLLHGFGNFPRHFSLSFELRKSCNVLKINLERQTGFEPATLSLGNRRKPLQLLLYQLFTSLEKTCAKRVPSKTAKFFNIPYIYILRTFVRKQGTPHLY